MAFKAINDSTGPDGLIPTLLVLRFLILSINLKLNTLLLCGMSLGLINLKTPFLSNPLISFWRNTTN